MKNPLINKEHLLQYLLYGSGAAIVYLIPTVIFLYRRAYENFYLLYIGSILFMIVIFLYTFKLLKQPYDKRRAVAMLSAGHLATLAGIVISTILVTLSFFLFYPNAFRTVPQKDIIKDVPAQLYVNQPIELLMMILVITVLVNFAVGSFISVVTAYVGKLNQTKDQPISLEKHI